MEKHPNSFCACEQVARTRLSDQSVLGMIPEWKKHYICYKKLKTLLNKEDRVGMLCYDYNNPRKPREEFFRNCEQELKKVNLFFSERLSEAHSRLATFEIVVREVPGSEGRGDIRRSDFIRTSSIKHIKMAVGELYLSLAFLQKYQEFNYRCFCKITTMYDLKLDSEYGVKWRNERLDASLLNTERSKCEHFMSKLEIFMLQLEGGDNIKAMKRLEVPQMGLTVRENGTVGQWIMFRIGFACGLSLMLLTIIASRAWNETDLDLLRPQLRLYKASFLLIEFLFLMGVNLYCYSTSAINHSLILGLDPRDHLSHYHIFEVAGGLTVCWCASVLASLHPPVLSIPQQLHPLIFHSFLLVLLLNPFSIFYAKARRWLMVTTPAGFAECWLADQFNSLIPLFIGLRDLLCFYTRQINWTDLPDLHTQMILMVLIGVVVTVCWDLKMDWGLLQGNGLLKEELLYSHQLYYYAAMLADVLLRISWAVNILLSQMKDSSAAATAFTIMAPLEVLRRFIWNLFRLENEQLKNLSS